MDKKRPSVNDMNQQARSEMAATVAESFISISSSNDSSTVNIEADSIIC